MEPLPKTLTLREIFAILRRHRTGMAVIVLISLMVGALSVFTATPIYQAQTDLLIDGGTQATQADPVNQVSLPTSTTDLPTQIQVLQSSKLLADAYQAAGIVLPSGELTPQQRETLLPTVKVDQVGATSVLQVRVESANPELAAQVAFWIPQTYMSYVKTTRQAEVDSALKFLAERSAAEKVSLKSAEDALQEFNRKRAATLMPLVNEGATRSEKVSSSEGEAARTEAAVASAQERLDALIAARTALPKNWHTPSSEANSAAIEAQKGVIADLIAKRNTLLITYTPEREEVKQVDQQIADARKRLDAIPKTLNTSTDTRHPEYLELDSKIAEARASLKGAQAEQAKIQAWAQQSEQSLKDYNRISPSQDELVRNVDDRKASILSLTKAADDLQIRRNMVKNPVTILTPGTGAFKVRPKPLQMMSIALLVGLFCAVGFAMFKDSLDDKLLSPDEVPTLTGLPALAEIPALPRRAPVLAADALSGKQMESYRILRFNVDFVTAEESVRSILVTSSGPREGKTDVACNLAIASAAGENRRVILVDANLRNPSVHAKMGLREGPGLVDVLSGHATLEEALQESPVPSLRVLSAGAAVTNAADMLSSPHMRTLIAKLSDSADLLVIDSPACLGFSDVQELATVVESVVYVARTGKATRSATRKGIESLRKLNARVLGVALSASRA